METTPTSSPTSAPAYSAPARLRNTFLLVICILTFIGSGFGILGTVFSFATADAVATMNSELNNQMETEQTPSFIKTLFSSAAENMTPNKIREAALAKLISCLLTLFGAIMMLKLKKPGFYLYVAGIIIFILLPIYMSGGLVGIAGSMLDGIIGIAFIVMYAVNLKQMNTKPVDNIAVDGV